MKAWLSRRNPHRLFFTSMGLVAWGGVLWVHDWTIWAHWFSWACAAGLLTLLLVGLKIEAWEWVDE